ncbi:hypothetical protein JW859_11135 [bacterium]|nr:hypothetical protein [bacterium]
MATRNSQITIMGIVTLVLVTACLAFLLSQCGMVRAINQSFCSEPCHEAVTTELRGSASGAGRPSNNTHQGVSVTQ